MRCLLLLGLIGCRAKPPPLGTIGTEPHASDADGDGDADGSDDGDDDGDADGSDDGDDDGDLDDTGTIVETFPCEEPIHPPALDDCVTREISCGDSFLSTTEGGTSLFTGVAYQRWSCEVVGPDSYTGSERVFAFDHPGGGLVRITLESPCDELDIFAVRTNQWEDSGTCPSDDTLLSDCDGDVSNDGGEVTLSEPSDDGFPYLVMVEGPEGQEANFQLTVTCPE